MTAGFVTDEPVEWDAGFRHHIVDEGVLVLGGKTASGTISSEAWIWDPTAVSCPFRPLPASANLPEPLGEGLLLFSPLPEPTFHLLGGRTHTETNPHIYSATLDELTQGFGWTPSGTFAGAPATSFTVGDNDPEGCSNPITDQVACPNFEEYQDGFDFLAWFAAIELGECSALTMVDWGWATYDAETGQCEEMVCTYLFTEEDGSETSEVLTIPCSLHVRTSVVDSECQFDPVYVDNEDWWAEAVDLPGVYGAAGGVNPLTGQMWAFGGTYTCTDCPTSADSFLGDAPYSVPLGGDLLSTDGVWTGSGAGGEWADAHLSPSDSTIEWEDPAFAFLSPVALEPLSRTGAAGTVLGFAWTPSGGGGWTQSEPIAVRLGGTRTHDILPGRWHDAFCSSLVCDHLCMAVRSTWTGMESPWTDALDGAIQSPAGLQSLPLSGCAEGECAWADHHQLDLSAPNNRWIGASMAALGPDRAVAAGHQLPRTDGQANGLIIERDTAGNLSLSESLSEACSDGPTLPSVLGNRKHLSLAAAPARNVVYAMGAEEGGTQLRIDRIFSAGEYRDPGPPRANATDADSVAWKACSLDLEDCDHPTEPQLRLRATLDTNPAPTDGARFTVETDQILELECGSVAPENCAVHQLRVELDPSWASFDSNLSDDQLEVGLTFEQDEPYSELITAPTTWIASHEWRTPEVELALTTTGTDRFLLLQLPRRMTHGDRVAISIRSRLRDQSVGGSCDEVAHRLTFADCALAPETFRMCRFDVGDPPATAMPDGLTHRTGWLLGGKIPLVQGIRGGSASLRTETTLISSGPTQPVGIAAGAVVDSDLIGNQQTVRFDVAPLGDTFYPLFLPQLEELAPVSAAGVTLQPWAQSPNTADLDTWLFGGGGTAAEAPRVLTRLFALSGLDQPGAERRTWLDPERPRHLIFGLAPPSILPMTGHGPPLRSNDGSACPAGWNAYTPPESTSQTFSSLMGLRDEDWIWVVGQRPDGTTYPPGLRNAIHELGHELYDHPAAMRENVYSEEGRWLREAIPELATWIIAADHNYQYAQTKDFNVAFPAASQRTEYKEFPDENLPHAILLGHEKRYYVDHSSPGIGGGGALATPLIWVPEEGLLSATCGGYEVAERYLSGSTSDHSPRLGADLDALKELAKTRGALLRPPADFNGVLNAGYRYGPYRLMQALIASIPELTEANVDRRFATLYSVTGMPKVDWSLLRSQLLRAESAGGWTLPEGYWNQHIRDSAAGVAILSLSRMDGSSLDFRKGYAVRQIQVDLYTTDKGCRQDMAKGVFEPWAVACRPGQEGTSGLPLGCTYNGVAVGSVVVQTTSSIERAIGWNEGPTPAPVVAPADTPIPLYFSLIANQRWQIGADHRQRHTLRPGAGEWLICPDPGEGHSLPACRANADGTPASLDREPDITDCKPDDANFYPGEPSIDPASLHVDTNCDGWTKPRR